MTDQNDWALYLIVRESLNMSPGKMAAQCGHAVEMICDKFRDLYYDAIVDGDHHNPDKILDPRYCDYIQWAKNNKRKIVLAASDKEFEKIKSEYKCFVVRDAGYTELIPGTQTVISLWPQQLHQRTGTLKHMKLLK
jgi:peptidyl-tRNA hydrolase